MRREAIVIGIDNYPEAPLQGCVNDAGDFSACLSLEQYDYNCTSLYNSDATRSNILEEFGKLAYGDGEDGILIFYFAGHGQVLGDQAHLVTYDARPHDPGISLAHLGQLMESASATYRHVIAILDSCHSGAAYHWTASRPLQANDIARDLVSVNESRCILAACRPEQVAYEMAGRGAFTSMLISGLLGDASNDRGEITILNLYEFVSGSNLENQIPVFKGDIAGTVVIGSGFPPRRGGTLSDYELRTVISKGRGLLDTYQHLQQRELAETDHRNTIGLATCAAELEPIVNWFESTEAGQGTLVANEEWQRMKDALNQYIAGITPMHAGQVVRAGTIERNLGRGGFGNVWLVQNSNDDLAAYKIYHPAELHDKIKVERFRNGYSNMRKLEHPRIVRVRELTVAPLGIAMDYIDGSNLRESFIDRNDSSLCLKILKEICETVEHAHGRGVKHRDIKPENIIIAYNDAGEPVPYLTDFDLAYHQTNRTMTALYGVGGVLNYAAPEQLHTPAAHAARSELVDVYSLAQLSYFIFTAEDPASDSPQQNRARLKRSLNDWGDPRAVKILQELYDSSSQKNPALRPESVAEFRSQVLRAEVFINALTNDDQLSEYDFIDRVAHSYRGVENYTMSGPVATMNSLSGQVFVGIASKGRSINSASHIDVELELSATGVIAVGTLTSGANARRVLNQRLDKVVRRYVNVERHPGSRGSFQTFIRIRSVPLSTDGIAVVTAVLADSVGCVDGA